MILSQLSARACDAIRPRVFVPTAEWAAANITLPKNSEIRGAFRLDLFPHMAEPFACFDDPRIRSITIQAASRLGKTVFAQVCLGKTAATNPHPMALADADEKSTKRVLKRTWEVFEAIPPLAEKLPPPRLRSSEQISLVDCLIHGAWSGSPSTAADFAALVVVLNEIDKMSRRASGEADFAFLMEERAKGYLHSKILRISTPGLKGESRIEAARLAGDNRARYVPCPHCNHFQTLQDGTPDSPGGLKWDKGPDGKSTPQIAFETAWYQCERCRKKILDEHRYAMLNAGVWVKEGQSIDDKGKITGTPTRPGPDASFGPLSSLHSLLPSITWGRCAKAFLDSRAEPEKRRNHANSWAGVTWDTGIKTPEWQDVGRRLALEYTRGNIPASVWFLTAGVDVQADRCYWIVRGWGEGGSSWLIDWGVQYKRFEPQGESILNSDLLQLPAVLIDRSWPVIGQTVDGYRQLWAAKVNIDTGHRIHDVHQFLRTQPGDRCRGVAGDHNVTAGFFRSSTLEKNARTGEAYEGGLVVWQLNVSAYKEDVQSRWQLKRGEAGAWYLPAKILQDGTDYLKQICAEAVVLEKGKRVWKATGDNHYWDCEVYARAAADFVTEGDWAAAASSQAPEQPPAAPFVRQPEGEDTGGPRNWIRRRSA